MVEAGSGEEALATIERARARASSCSTCGCPGIDGFEVLRRLETTGARVPVILVTSLEDEVDQLVGYRLGAVDYVVKPVSPKVLAAKVKSFTSRIVEGERAAAAHRRAGRSSIEHDAHRVLVDGAEVRAHAARVRPARRARASTPAGSTRATTCCSRCGASTPARSRRGSSTSTSRTCGASSPRPARTASCTRFAASATGSPRRPPDRSS